MRNALKIFSTALFVISFFALCAESEVRLKDVAFIKDQSEIQLKGLGIVTGLNGTGDGKNTQFTIRMIGNMMRNMGIEVPTTSIKVKNVAAVMVTATVSPYVKSGGAFDVNVSSVGDAKSLEGGTLMLTMLSDENDFVYAKAQGPLTIGGANKNYGGNPIVTNANLTGIVASGGILEKELPTMAADEISLTVSLREPDYTTVFRLASAINTYFKSELAVAKDAGNITVKVPESYSSKGDLVKFVSEMEVVSFEPDETARVVINERTGTIIAGANVTLSPVAIMQGNLQLTIGQNTQAQPGTPIVQGKNGDRMINLGSVANVGQISSALNMLGVTPRDLIAIFQALKSAGSLRAELIII
jgi:flagellar P-ring protein FlgI